MVDSKIFLAIMIFLSMFLFIQAIFGAEYVNTVEGWTANYTNSSTVAISGNLVAPPKCSPVATDARTVIDIIMFEPVDNDTYAGFCTGDWLNWYLSLMYFNSAVNWLNTIILLPITIFICLMLFRYARGLS